MSRLGPSVLLGSAQQPFIGKREVASGTSDDNVVHDIDAEELAGFGQSMRNGAIFLAGLGVTTGVVVAAQNGGSIGENSRFKDFARMHDTGGQAPHGHGMDADDVVFLIEHEHDKMFAVHIGQVRRKHPGCISRTPELVLIAGYLSFPYEHHTIHREVRLCLVPLLKQG